MQFIISIIFSQVNKVYPINGGSEDWSYAAGWENDFSPIAVVTECPEHKIKTSHIKPLLFLLECDILKSPPEMYYGSSSGLLFKSKKIKLKAIYFLRFK